VQRGRAREGAERQIGPVGEQLADRRLLAAAGGHVERVGHDLGLRLGRTRQARAVGGVARAAVIEARARSRPSGPKKARTRATSPRPAAAERSGSTPPATRARAQSCASMVTAQDSGVWAEWA